MGTSSRSLHPQHVQKKIQSNMHRSNYRTMGSLIGKQHRRIHPRRLSVDGLRRQRKANRKGLANAHPSNGNDRERRIAAHGNNYARVLPLQDSLTQTAQDPAKQFPRHYGRGLGRGSTSMKKNNIWELILKVIVAAITAALTAITTTSCIGYGPF